MVTGMERETENYVQSHCILFFLEKKRELPWNQVTVQKTETENPTHFAIVELQSLAFFQ